MKGSLWIDALTPKQALFTKALVQRAPSKIKCSVTTRDYSELNQFLDQIHLEHVSIGRHGGASQVEKLRSSVQRTEELISFAKGEFDYSLSYLSPEAARVGFGLGLKHYVCSDSPHSNAPCRLAVPLSAGIFTPFVISRGRWTRYGISEDNVWKYHALDPWAWLLGSKYRKQSTQKVTGKVIIRLEESFASYFRQGKGISDVLSKLVRAIKESGDFEILLLPRYDEQRSWARKEFGGNCTVPDSTVDAADELTKSDLLVGGGATMTQEASLLGIPNISYFPSARLDVFYEYYFPRKLSVGATSSKQLIRETKRLLKNIDREKLVFSRRAAKETKSYQDPVRFIFEKMI